MKYFLVKQNESQKDMPKISNWYKKVDKHSLDKREYNKIPYRTVLSIDPNSNVKFVDIIICPFLLISKDLKKLIILFEPNLKFKEFFLQDSINGKMKEYFFPLLESIDCLYKDSIFNLDKSVIKKGIIDESKLKDKAIFLIKNMNSQQIVMRMDLVEAIIRRDYTGISFIELEKNVEENR